MKLIKITDLPELYNVPAMNAYAPISHYRKKHNKEDPPWYHQRGGIGYVDVDYIEKVSTLSSRISLWAVLGTNGGHGTKYVSRENEQSDRQI